jgi:hypothetical protein
LSPPFQPPLKWHTPGFRSVRVVMKGFLARLCVFEGVGSHLPKGFHNSFTIRVFCWADTFTIKSFKSNQSKHKPGNAGPTGRPLFRWSGRSDPAVWRSSLRYRRIELVAA